MAYIPNPDDATQPTDATVAETMQAEFRALKTKLNGLAVVVNTWNTLDKSANITCSGGNLIANSTATATANSVRATVGKSAGKWYWEVTLNLLTGSAYIGISKLSDPIANYIGQTANSFSYLNTAFKRTNATSIAYGAAYTTGDVIGVAMDCDNGTLTFYKNGASQGVAYSAGITGLTYYPSLTLTTLTDSAQVNFGSSTFSYPIPNGFSGFTTASIPAPGFQNRIINGRCEIDQRNSGAAQNAIVSNSYMSDRWRYDATQAGKFNAQRQNGLAGMPAGYQYCQTVTVANAYTVLAADYFSILQAIEGVNILDLDYGLPTAKTCTLLFWVSSSVVGLHSGSLRNAGNLRSYPFFFTITTANIWQQVAIIIPGDTAGTWSTNTNVGITVVFNLGSGTTFSSTAGSWQTGNFSAATNAVSVVANAAATFYFTGVEFKPGIFAVGSAPERIPFDTELQRCQRYFRKTSNSVNLQGNAYSASDATYQTYNFSPSMRVVPTCSNNFSFGTNNATNTVQCIATDSIQLYLTSITSGVMAVTYNSGNSLSAEF